ncbi:DUF4396 domain-containing protein [Nocardioides ferulae]|uniref:DUF4396 domain-containing protein n=1 Tax=Nocardioides ferulae TaxID=2340821 RepID=UPI001F0BB8D9|nr:DUF4396 domain-containing protein [Nocardioides ferulae]
MAIDMDQTWRTAITATRHCLTGCAIGEVLGMALATWWGWSDLPSIALAVALAFFFGYLLTYWSVRRAGLSVRDAVRAALAADTVSILVMEVVDNGFLLAWPGAMDAMLSDWLFWAALAMALAVAFVVTVPVNHALIARGRGHAVVHAMHHEGHEGHEGHEVSAGSTTEADSTTEAGSTPGHSNDESHDQGRSGGTGHQHHG